MTWYLGIDQSYSGFAMVFYDALTGEHLGFLEKFEPKKYGTGIDRLIAIHKHVTTTLWRAKGEFAAQPVHVCMEGYANGAKFGREAAGELGAIVKMALRNFATTTAYPTIVPPTSLKKFVTGKGNAKKNEMLLAVYKRWGIEYEDDNLADAYSLARVARALDGGAENLSEFQRDVIAALNISTEKFPK